MALNPLGSPEVINLNTHRSFPENCAIRVQVAGIDVEVSSNHTVSASPRSGCRGRTLVRWCQDRPSVNICVRPERSPQ